MLFISRKKIALCLSFVIIILTLNTQVHAQDYAWAKSMGSTGNDLCPGIAVDVSGNVYTTGYFEGTVDFDPGVGIVNLTSVGGQDIFVSKLDASGNFVWAKRMGGTGGATGLGITIDASGNVYTTGFFQNTVDFDPGAGTVNLTSIGNTDIFVSKLDALGNFIWAKRMGGINQDIAYSIVTDALGNVYTTGYFEGTADFDPNAGIANLTSAGNYDIFVSKLDAAGNFVWAKRMGGISEDIAYNITTDASGNVYTTGSFQGTADFDPGAGTANLTSVGSIDIFVSKLDASGNFVWAKSMGTTGTDAGNGIAIDALGNVYTTGFFQGTVDFDPGLGTANLVSMGVVDIFVSKLDASGNFVWAKSMGGIGNDQGRKITTDTSGNIYTIGYFEGTSDFDPGLGNTNLTSAGNADIFVSKLSASGNFVWARRMGGSSDDAGRNIVIDASSNVYISGEFGGTVDFDPGAGIANLTSAGGNDIFVSKLSQTAVGVSITALNVTPNSFMANWILQVNATDYRIDVSTDPNFGVGFFVLQDFVVGNVASYNVTGLSPNMVYYYRVQPFVSVWLGESNTKMTSTILPAGSGAGLSFNGTAKKVDATNNNAFNFVSGTNAFTLEAWVKINAIGSEMDIISKRIFAGAGYALVITNTGRLGIVKDNSLTAASIVLPTNTWVHVSVSVSVGGSYMAYVNGVLDSTGGATTISTNALSLTIGSRPDNGFPFNGQIDEVKVWNITRTQAQIQASMCSKLAGTESGLVAYFRFDENTGTITENEASGATFDGTLISSPAWAVSTAPIGDISAYNATLNDTTPFVDAFSLSNITGSPTGYYLYKVKAQPNILTPPTNYLGIFNTQYYGIFFPNGTNPTASIEYSYGTNPNISNGNSLRFARRDDVNSATWTRYGGIVNRLNRTIDKNNATAGQYILASRNSAISNAKNGGTALNFTGSQSGVATNPFTTDNDFTIELWVRPNTIPSSGTSWSQGDRLVDLSNSGINDFGASLLQSAGNTKVAFGTRDAVGTSTTLISTTNISLGTWYHIAITRNKTTNVIELYINGKFEISTTTTATTLSLPSISFGRANGGGNQSDATIDDVKCWKNVLSANTIKDWMNLRANDSHPNFVNLAAYYRCDDNMGVFAEDIANGNEINLTGGSMWTIATQPLGDGAAKRLTVSVPNSVQNFSEPGVEISFGSPTVPNGDVVVTRLDTAPDTYPNVAGMNFMSSYWIVRNYGTNLTFTNLEEIKFEVPAGNTISAADLLTPNNIKLFKRPDNATGNTWGVPVAQATGFGSVRFKSGPPTGFGNVITEFSQFVIGSQSSPLAVSWVNFDGQRKSNNRVDLRWNTATESKNKGFEIQRSLDGVNFTVIGFKDGAGNSSQNRRYDFTDEEAIKSYYYRLRQIDNDDSFEFSKVIFIKSETKDEVLLVYPNPTTESIQLQTKTDWANNPNLRAEVISADGKSILQSKGNLLDIQESINIWLKNAKSGVYIIKLVTPEKVLQTKLVKENR